MSALGVQIVFDAHDPYALGQFWVQALGYVEQPPPDGFASWDEALTAWGLPPERRNDAYAIVDPDGRGPRVFLQRVPEPKTAKNRVHLDIAASRRGDDDREPRDRVRAHVAFLEGLGAVRRAEFGADDPDAEYWIVMTDPEGNEFCVQ